MSITRAHGRLLASTVALAAGIGAVIPASPAAQVVADSPVKVILAATTSALGRQAVESVGGRVTQDLPLIDAVAATLPAAAVPLLEGRPGVLAVVPDEKVHVQGGFDTAAPAMSPAGELPLSVHRAAVKSKKLADAGGTGAGVTVAVLDTGITVGPELAGRVKSVQVTQSGEMAPCLNLSGTPDCDDDYGHGTFMAGLIAGSGDASGNYAGVAPEASLVSIKVGGEDGSADVSNVLAGIQWAVSFRTKYNIKVLNLSLGTNSTQSWRVDPLNRAVERAWDAGITVVVAASNRGPAPRTISKPGDDPYVITVGASDDQATAAIGNDVVPDFSSRGPAWDGTTDIAKPDVVAPGAKLVSLRAPGSLIDGLHPDPGNSYLVGSGTSMATAVTSGVVAQILSKNPKFKPDRVKYVLRETARPVAGGQVADIGEGIIDAYAAGVRPPAGTANGGLPLLLPLGSIIGSRGTVVVELEPLGTLLNGLLTAQNRVFLPDNFLNTWRPATWWTSQWAGHPWYATTWSGDNWEGDNWEGCIVGGESDDVCTYGEPTSGSKWYGAWD